MRHDLACRGSEWPIRAAALGQASGTDSQVEIGISARKLAVCVCGGQKADVLAETASDRTCCILLLSDLLIDMIGFAYNGEALHVEPGRCEVLDCRLC